jgi:hypothetical protein
LYAGFDLEPLADGDQKWYRMLTTDSTDSDLRRAAI